ncbi:Peptidase family M50 [Rosistilla ulvae]|uniref:Peptidase family M50 n=1 Tax=Rosistilla ulvae TaxID=1930277 RepID=A0A517LWT8_9BACT|nr:HlyD family efflux transporter periplasmic adaptor subunit [Rosistilla ulvae]QDS87087.1 Peptidase family M50 [Rosistilla ulvae]
MNALIIPPVSHPLATAPSSRLVLRDDLIHRRVQMGNRTLWVIKDPVSSDFFYFSEREYTVLSVLDGRSPDAIAAEYRRHHGNDVLSSDHLVSFLAQVQRSGLLRGSPKTTGTESIPAARSRAGFRAGLLSPLAIRLPGVNPDRLLDWLEPKTRWIFAPLTLGCALLWIVFAAVIVGLRAETFFLELRQSQAWASAGMMGVVILVIAITKIVHELAHAVTCRRFGGSCTEIGVMFLVMIPCLYCDVSNAWLQPRRSRRIAISAAGILAELWIAATAAVLWSITIDGPLHWICLSIVVVCSVSTLLFNGNPLMRYDGYYILSDLLQIPNLAAESSAALMRRIKHLATGIRDVPSADRGRRSELLLIGYAIASLGYRMVVIGAILFAIHKLGIAYDLRIAAWLVTAPMLFGLVRGMGRQVGTMRLSAMERRSVRRGRVAIGYLGILAFVIGLLLIPLPHRITLPAIAKAVDQQDVYVVQPGSLVSAVVEGTQVEVGDEIAQLKNRDLDLELESLAAQATALDQRLDRVASLRSEDPKYAAQIPALTEGIAAIQEKIALRKREQAALRIVAPAAGLVFAAPPRQLSADESTADDAWSGTLLQPHNIGSFVPRGTHLCSIGSPTARTVSLLASHREIGFVRPGQTVALYAPGSPGGRVHGTVTQIDAQPLTHLPRELVINQQVSVEPGKLGGAQPLEPTYQIQVAVSQNDVPLRLRTASTARVHVGYRSLLGRLSRFLADSLRFELNP